MRLSIVIPVLNQFPLTIATYKQLREVTDTLDDDVEFLIIDNGSRVPLDESDVPGATIIRNEYTVGVYPTFLQGFNNTTGDIVAFFHSDLVVWEQNWNERLIKQFQDNTNLGMVGFIGSNEIDASGGRGLGTTSNFQGRTLSDGLNVWQGSPASVHGKVSDQLSSAAVVDGCAMIISRDAWEDIGNRDDFPPHHHYDRLISCQLLEKGWDVGVLGIECDHFSGQTVNQEDSYSVMAQGWAGKSLGVNSFMEWAEKNKEWTNNSSNPNRGKIPHNWDSVVYMESEKRFLLEYRDEKHLIPIIKK